MSLSIVPGVFLGDIIPVIWKYYVLVSFSVHYLFAVRVVLLSTQIRKLEQLGKVTCGRIVLCWFAPSCSDVDD